MRLSYNIRNNFRSRGAWEIAGMWDGAYSTLFSINLGLYLREFSNSSWIL